MSQLIHSHRESPYIKIGSFHSINKKYPCYNKKMAWIDNYLTGIEEIDLEHRELFEIVMKMKESIESDKMDKKTLIKMLKFLINYTMFHFSSEEEYMERIKFKEITLHKNVHRHFTNIITEILNDIKDNKIFDPLTLYTYLVEWLKNHIAKEDQKFLLAGGNIKSSKAPVESEEAIFNTIISKLYHIDTMLQDGLIDKEEYKSKKIKYINACIKGHRINYLVDLKMILEAILMLSDRSLISDPKLLDFNKIIIMNINKNLKNEAIELLKAYNFI